MSQGRSLSLIGALLAEAPRNKQPMTGRETKMQSSGEQSNREIPTIEITAQAREEERRERERRKEKWWGSDRE